MPGKLPSRLALLGSPHLRVASATFVLFACGLSALSEVTRVGVSGLDLGMFLYGLGAPLWALWVTEPEDPPSSWLARLEGSRAPRWLIALFLPGGGRAALLVTAEILALCAASLLGRVLARATGGELWGFEGWVKTGMVACYLLVWLLLPSALFNRWLHRGAVRLLALGAIPAFGLALPTLLSWLGPWVPDYTGNVFAHFPHVRHDGFVPVKYRPAYFTMVAAALAAIALNVPRMARGVRAVA